MARTPSIPGAQASPRRTWRERLKIWWRGPVIITGYCTKCGRPKDPLPGLITQYICWGLTKNDQCLPLKVSLE